MPDPKSKSSFRPEDNWIWDTVAGIRYLQQLSVVDATSYVVWDDIVATLVSGKFTLYPPRSSQFGQRSKESPEDVVKAQQ